MSNITGSGYLGRYIQELRDRAVIARRIAKELSDEEAAKSLEKHALDFLAQDPRRPSLDAAHLGVELALEGILPAPEPGATPTHGRIGVFIAKEIVHLHGGSIQAGTGTNGPEISLSIRQW